MGSALVIVGLLIVAVGFVRGDSPPAHVAGEPIDNGVTGTYALADGRYLTVFGTAASLRFELEGRVTHLVARGEDQFASMGGDDTVSVERDDTGKVSALDVRTGEGRLTARPADLYSQHDVAFSNGDVRLAGRVLTPDESGSHPGVVIVHGAEPNATRDNYMLLASHFARRGVAALVYDKRGVGESTGNFANATFDDLAADTRAAVNTLAAQPGVDPQRVGVLGFSQGAWVVAKAAAAHREIAFVAAYSPSGFSPGDQQAWLQGSMLAARGFDRAAMRLGDRVSRMLYSSLDLVDAGLMPPIPHVPGFWFHALDLHTDTTALWQQVRQPTLLAWGALDCQVPSHDSRDTITQALQSSGNTNVTFAVMPDADHSFTLGEPCGHETGMAHHASMHHADGYFDLGPTWIRSLDGYDGGPTPLPQAARPATTILDWHIAPPAPAPWYGTLAVQLTTIVLLLASFGGIALRSIFAIVRRRMSGTHTTWSAPLVGLTGTFGLLATIIGFASLIEIAMLADTGASFIVGGPTVSGITHLMAAARVLVVLAITAGVASAVADRRRPAAAVVATATAVLAAWAHYWQLTPLA